MLSAWPASSQRICVPVIFDDFAKLGYYRSLIIKSVKSQKHTSPSKRPSLRPTLAENRKILSLLRLQTCPASPVQLTSATTYWAQTTVVTAASSSGFEARVCKRRRDQVLVEDKCFDCAFLGLVTNVWFSGLQEALGVLLLRAARPSQGYRGTSSRLPDSLCAERRRGTTGAFCKSELTFAGGG